jgi:hypothetical protein
MTLEGTLAFLSAYWPEILSIVALVLMSAFFSGSETALTAVSRSRIHTLEANGEERAGIVRELIERRDRLIGALLIGNNLANILSSSIATSLFLGLFGNSGVALGDAGDDGHPRHLRRSAAEELGDLDPGSVRAEGGVCRQGLRRRRRPGFLVRQPRSSAGSCRSSASTSRAKLDALGPRGTARRGRSAAP